MLVDAAAYFEAVHAALREARKSVLIVGWDLHSQVDLLPGAADRAAGWPTRLEPFLRALVEARPELEVRILTWDFAMIYLAEREILPVFRLPWRSHPRLHFRYDGNHPIGASHHQKLVIVDDRVAFSGGLDLTINRWDTPAHRETEPLRCSPDGVPYGPFHDVQAVVDGAAAAALGELARERWRRASGERVDRVATNADPWPAGVEPDMTRVDVGIARTDPAHDGRGDKREVERLFIESIAAGREAIYIENQYFSSIAITDALAESLAQPDGPEIVMVLPYRTSGWLEETAMGSARIRILERLREADRHGRFAAFYPRLPFGDGTRLKVHAKVMTVDDRLARVGSANLSNRSMGLDTECDLAVEARDEQTAEAVLALRNRLLAEHLGRKPDDVAAAVRRAGSLIRGLRNLDDGPRGLEPLRETIPESMKGLLPDPRLMDPERPIDLGRLTREMLHEDGGAEGGDTGTAQDGEDATAPGRGGFGRALVLAVALAATAGLAVAWRATPLAAFAAPENLLGWIASSREDPAVALYMMGAFLAGSLVAFPVTVLILAAGLLLGPVTGFGVALAGAMTAAILTFGIGRAVGRNAVRRLGGSRINRASRALGRRGMLAVIFTRLVPLAPFTVINLVAGASHIGFGSFIVGTAIGMAPGIAALVVFGDGLVAALRSPSLQALAVMAGAVIAVIGIGYTAQRWARRRFAPVREPDDAALA